MTGKERVDTILVQRGFFLSREKAQAAIMAGQVYSGEKKNTETFGKIFGRCCTSSSQSRN